MTTALKELGPKGSDRKFHILKSAAHVFLELGYDATSMNVIAERADVTKPGLYYHFESKQDLLYAIMSYAMDVLEAVTAEAAAAATDSASRLRAMIHALAEITVEQEDGAFTILVIDETKALLGRHYREITERKRAYYDTVRRAIEELSAEGRLRRLDSTVATFTLLGMVLWLSKWFERDGRVSGDDVASQVTDMAMAAVLS